MPFPSPMHKMKSESEVTQSCPTLRDPMDRSPPGSSIHGIFQARILEWGAIDFSTLWARRLQMTSRTCPVRQTPWGSHSIDRLLWVRPFSLLQSAEARVAESPVRGHAGLLPKPIIQDPETFQEENPVSEWKGGPVCSTQPTPMGGL